MACLHRVAMGTSLLSQLSWSVHLERGRPGGRFLVGSVGRPTDSSTWRSMAWCVGMLSGNLATCPNMALRPLVIRSDTGARPVRKETSEIWTKSCIVGLLLPDCGCRVPSRNCGCCIVISVDIVYWFVINVSLCTKCRLTCVNTVYFVSS